MSTAKNDPHAKPEASPAKNGLTSAQVTELRAALTTKQKDLEGKRLRRGPEHQAQADPMDAATDTTTETEELGLSAHDDQLRREVDHALAKFGGNSYGISELSGRGIGYERLKIVPWARLTVDEEEKLDRQRR